MRDFIFEPDGNTLQIITTTEGAEIIARDLVASTKKPCRFYPLDGSNAARVIHLMKDCPTCKGKGVIVIDLYAGNKRTEECKNCLGRRRIATK